MLPFSFFFLLALVVLGFCGQALPLNVSTGCLVPFPLLPAVLGTVMMSLSCSVLSFPCCLLFISLPSWHWRVWGDGRHGLFSILDIWCLRHRDLWWVMGHEDFFGMSWGQVSPKFYNRRAIQNLCRTVIVVSWKSVAVFVR